MTREEAMTAVLVAAQKWEYERTRLIEATEKNPGTASISWVPLGLAEDNLKAAVRVLNDYGNAR